MKIRACIIFICLMLSASALCETYVFDFDGACFVTDESGKPLFDAETAVKIYRLRDPAGETRGYAAKDASGRYAIIDTNGEYITDFLYNGIMCSEDLFIAEYGGSIYYIKPDGETNKTKYCSFTLTGTDSALALKGGSFDETADTLNVVYRQGISFESSIKSIYETGVFSEGLMAICDYSSGLFGYCDKDGGWVIAPEYRYAGEFIDGCTIVSDNEGYLLIDTAGKKLTRRRYMFMQRGDSCVWADDGMSAYAFDFAGNMTCAIEMEKRSLSVAGAYAVLSDEDTSFVYDTGGKLMFSKDGIISSSSGERFIVKEKDGAYLCSHDGEALTGCFPDMGFIAYDLIEAENENGEHALFDLNGNIVCDFENCDFACDGMICAKKTENGIDIIRFSD